MLPRERLLIRSVFEVLHTPFEFSNALVFGVFGTTHVCPDYEWETESEEKSDGAKDGSVKSAKSAPTDE